MNALLPRVLTILVLCALPCWGDVLILKAGQHLEGEVQEKGSSYEVRTVQGTILIAKSEVARRVRSLEAIEAEGKALQDKARSLYDEALKIDGDAKAANDKLKQGVELLRKAAELYQDARETYTEEKHATLDQTTVRLFQEIRLFRDKMTSELAKGPPTTPPATPPEPGNAPSPEAKTPVAPAPAAKGPAPKPDLQALMTAAKAGDLEAMFIVGCHYEAGEWNPTEGMKWLKAAAEKNHVRAWARIGLLALEGRGARPDAKEAVKWLYKAEAKGEPLAKVYLGQMQFLGIGTPKSLKKANEYCEHAMPALRMDVLSGDPDAETAYGWMSLEGMGTVQNTTQAVSLFRSAAEKGSVRAQVWLGRIHDEGRAGPRDPKEAEKWFRMAADRGFAEALARLGIFHDEFQNKPPNPNKDLAASRSYYEKDAAQGDPVGLFHLGVMYEKGKAAEVDYAQALHYYQLASQKAWGSVQWDALNCIGALYGNGKGMKADPKEAVKYFRQAADAGNDGAQSNMGVYSWREQNDIHEAMRWWQLAARNGNSRAAFELGDAYFTSKGGIKKDLVEAQRWLLVGVQRGDKNAPSLLSQVQQELSAKKK